MDYSNIYITLMERSFERSLDCYTEKHHIIPKCMDGDDKPRNIAILTPEEHYVAHQLLAKIYPKNYKLCHCLSLLSKNSGNNKMYGWIRKKVSESQKGKQISLETRQKISDSIKGKNHHMFGKKHSLESRQKMSESQKQCSPELRQKRSELSKGRKHSLESRQKISDAQRGAKGNNFGKKASLETRQKLSDSHKGRQCSLETRQKISESQKGAKGHMFGKKHSLESQNNMKLAQRKRRQNEKAISTSLSTPNIEI